MAEIISKSGKGCKSAPRIDLTPMVDLGFLLITFFIMTTTMAKPKALTIQMPYKGEEKSATTFYESSAITLIPAGPKSIYYYEGIFNPLVPFKKVNNIEALRHILQTKEKQLKLRPKVEERNLQVLIKPNDNANLDNIVALLDEMNILKIDYYAMVDLSKEEQKMIAP